MGKMGFKAGIGLAGAALLGFVSSASATLTTFQAYSGNVGVSVYGGGSVAATLPLGLTAEIPTGSTVVAAYLYTSTYNVSLGAAGSLVPSASAGGTFGGSAVTYTALIPNASSAIALQAGRADVTATVKALVNPLNAVAVGGVYNFAVTETNTSLQDGEVLIVVYSNPLTPTASVGILDGAASSAGDSSAINFASSPVGSTVYMSIGDGFSYDLGGGTQHSTITVDGHNLTTVAGNCDDSQDGGPVPNATSCGNGDLITAGILGLNANGTVNAAYSNPFTPIGDTVDTTDHELYNISTLITSAGNTINLTTFNTSADDNIFEEVFYANGLAGFNAPPPPASGASPEPGSFILMGTGAALGVFNKFRRRKV